MSGNREVTYALDFGAGRKGRREKEIHSSDGQPPEDEGSGSSVPRIARLIALAIRFERLPHDKKIRDDAELSLLAGSTQRTWRPPRISKRFRRVSYGKCKGFG